MKANNQAVVAKYRVREARIEVCDGYKCWRERRFIAERRVSFLGLLSWWWPVIDSDWRASADMARLDAKNDASLRLPLAKPEFVRFTQEAT